MSTVSPLPRSLGDVVTAAKIRQGVDSGRQLAERSRRLGIPISYTTLNQIENGEYRSSLTEDLRHRLAELSGISYAAISRLADLPISAPFKLPESANSLTGDQRDAILGVVRAFVRSNAAVENEIVAAMEDRGDDDTPAGQSEEPDT